MDLKQSLKKKIELFQELIKKKKKKVIIYYLVKIILKLFQMLNHQVIFLINLFFHLTFVDL